MTVSALGMTVSALGMTVAALGVTALCALSAGAALAQDAFRGIIQNIGIQPE